MPPLNRLYESRTGAMSRCKAGLTSIAFDDNFLFVRWGGGVCARGDEKAYP